ncbi:MAG: putative porin [Gammaproteobacteria bacterium]|nr:putative porin [Gammaproteobacteria bacterium]NNF61409.1 hypothetical protein [Gammaproteobacteria bacterium]
MTGPCRWLTIFVLGFSFSLPALAADDDIAELRAEIERLSQRLEQLEQDRRERHEEKVVSVPAPRQEKQLKFKGDVRYRYEMIDQEGKEDRNRNRVRARFGATARVNDSVKAGIQLGTGGDSPVSGNQSLDGGFSRKDFGLNLAYVTWQMAPGSSLTAGKMKNPLHRAGGHGLIWDSDVNPEGVAWQYQANGVFTNVVGLYVEERSSADDSLMFGGQLGFDTDVAEDMDFKGGIGYYVYTNTVGNKPFFDGDDSAGNTLVDGLLVNDYRQVELFAELGLKVSEWPAAVFANYVQNTDASDNDTGYAVGISVGQFSWAYQDLEADAVIGTFADSDFGGGGTGVSGHVFKAKHPIAKNWAASLTFFLNDFGAPGAPEKDYRRLQADMQFKF